MKQCKCGSKLFRIDIKSCIDCAYNGALSEFDSYVYDEIKIEREGLERRQIEDTGECLFGTSFGIGCHMYICNNCNEKSNLPILQGR